MAASDPTSFDRDIRPLFRDRDLRSMAFAFDLSSYDDVSEHADAILARLVAGTMPCDGAWPPGTGRPLPALDPERNARLTASTMP